MKLFDLFCVTLVAGIASVYCDAEEGFMPASSDVDKRLKFDIGKKRHFDDKRLRFDIGRKRAWEEGQENDYAQELVLGMADGVHDYLANNADDSVSKRLYDMSKRLRFDIGKRLKFDIGKRLGADESNDLVVIGGVEIPVCAQEDEPGLSLCGFAPMGGRWWPICSDNCEELKADSYD